MAGISVDNVTDAVENTVYTAVGLGILGFQHLQVGRGGSGHEAETSSGARRRRVR